MSKTPNDPTAYSIRRSTIHKVYILIDLDQRDSYRDENNNIMRISHGPVVALRYRMPETEGGEAAAGKNYALPPILVRH